MTKRQAQTLIALAIAIICMQVLCICMILRGQVRAARSEEVAAARAVKASEAMEGSLMDVVELQKQIMRR